jgi:anti-sigma regulatory factor (Ser/Thr protein kinase)
MRTVVVDASVETKVFGVSPHEIGGIDRWVETVGRQWGESNRTVFGARLCIAELAANVLEHGVAKATRDQIIVSLRRCGDGIGIEFVDSREPFDPTRTPAISAPGPDFIAPTGRGLRLLHAYADELSYCNDGTYNRVTLKIRSDTRGAGRVPSGDTQASPPR